MSEKEIEKEIRQLEKLLASKKRKLKRVKRIRPRRIFIPKTKLKRLVRRNLTTREIAQRFKVSKRTVTRRIKAYGLKGIRPRGRKPKITGWMNTRKYIEELDRQYHFAQGTKTIPYPYINTKTLVCSNQKTNPKGKFNILQAYFIVSYDKVYLIFDHTFMYRMKPVPFKEIFSWTERHALENLKRIFNRAKFQIEKVVGYGFTKAKKVTYTNHEGH